MPGRKNARSSTPFSNPTILPSTTSLYLGPQFGSDLGQERLVASAGGFSPRAVSSAAFLCHLPMKQPLLSRWVSRRYSPAVFVHAQHG